MSSSLLPKFFAALILTGGLCRAASACDSIPEKLDPVLTFTNVNRSYSLPGMKGFTSVPTSSGTAYRTATYSGEVTQINTVVGVSSYNPDTGEVGPYTVTTTTTGVTGTRGSKQLITDGTITDTSAFYGSTTVATSSTDGSNSSSTTSYEYKPTDANTFFYFQAYGSYQPSSDSVAALPITPVARHKTKEKYAYVQRFVTLLFDVDGNITSATGLNASTGQTFDPYNDPFPWGPLVETDYLEITGASTITLSNSFSVPDALANPSGVPVTVTTTAPGQNGENSAYSPTPDWHIAQSVDHDVYKWQWTTQGTRIKAIFPSTCCPGIYSVVAKWSKAPRPGVTGGTFGDWSTQEEVPFNDPTNAVVEYDIPIVDPAVGVTESKDKYFYTEITAEKICEAREEGDAAYDFGSVHAGFFLGRKSGWIRLDSDSLGWWTVSPSRNELSMPARPGVTEWVPSDDGLTYQFKSPDTFVHFAVASDYNSYQMDFYHASQVGAKDPVTHFYALTGSPYARYLVSNPDPNNSNGGKLRIEKTIGTDLRAVEYSYAHATVSGVPTDYWTFTNGGTLQKSTRSGSSNQNQSVLLETYDLANNLVTSVRQNYTKMNIPSNGFSTSQMLTQEIVDPSGLARTTTYEYHYNPSLTYAAGLASNPGYGKLKQITRPDGSWESYTYDSSRNPTKTLRPYLNAAPTTDEAQCRVSQVLRSSLADSDGDGSPESMVEEVESIQGQPVSRTYKISWSKPAMLGTGTFRKSSFIRCTVAGVPWNDSTNLVTTTYSYTTAPFSGEARLVINPDGSTTSRVLSIDGQGNKVVDTRVGQPDSAPGGPTTVIDGRRTISTFNPTGHQISEQNSDIATGLALLGWTAATFDSSNRATRLNYTDGTFVLRSYACCGLESETDRQGITTSYNYDSGRVVLSSRAGISARYVYDAAGRRTATYRRGTDGSEIALLQDTYNAAGDLISSADAANRATTYARSTDASGQTTLTTTLPGGGTRIEVLARDGLRLSVSGTAAEPHNYEYGADAAGTFIKDISVGVDGNNQPTSTEWVKTYTDFAGRPLKTIFADNATEQSFYNTAGQLVRQVDPDGVTTLFGYNLRGEQDTTATDMNGNNAIDPAETDRITKTINTVATKTDSSGSYIVLRTTTQVWEADNANSPVDVSISEQSSDGRRTWHTERGLTATTVTVFDGASGRTVTTTKPDGVKTIQVYSNDRLLSTTVKTTADVQLSASTYTYDPHGRLLSSNDARNGATTYTYFADDQINTVTTPDPDAGRSGEGYDAQVTTYHYDNAGRQDTVTSHDGGVVTTTYWPTGAVKRVSGTRTYPVEYTYDPQGRVQTLTTWRNYAGDAGKAVTTWNYYADRGFLQSKRYADNTGLAYTYWPSGRLKMRAMSRSPVHKTNYTYNVAGDLETTDYLLSSTPDVTINYDRAGRPKTITDGSGSRTLTYHSSGPLQSETYTAGLLSGLAVTRTYDLSPTDPQYPLKRLYGVGFSISSSPSYDVTYGYDVASGRFKSVKIGSGSGGGEITYGYLANSDLVETVTFNNANAARLTTTKTYDKLNRLAKIDNIPTGSGASPLTYIYDYNNANQRVRVTREDSAYWNYGYDSLGQVTSSKKYNSSNAAIPGHDFAWTFDDIGNRKTSTVNGASASYTTNSLNQYTSRTVTGAIDVLGAASATATVTVGVNGGAPQATTRQGELFYKQVTVDNTTAAQNTALKITGVKKLAGPNQEDVVTEITKTAFVAKTPETFATDSDGNLDLDARWRYEWDVENRLTAVETSADAAAAGVTKQRLEFAYDGQSRRVSKKVYAWNGSSYQLTTHTLFIYAGWNLLAELNALSSNAAIRTYAWGLDLSGTLQGASGVGGLLAITDAAISTTHFVALDDSGNVTGLVKALDGTVSAKYDYNAFGEPILIEGAFAFNNPFRFSTKPADSETGYSYYGYRFYAPETGRWLSRDPIEERGGENLYEFVGNRPTVAFDPNGLFEILVPRLVPFVETLKPTVEMVKPAAESAKPNYPSPLPNPGQYPMVGPQFTGRGQPRWRIETEENSNPDEWLLRGMTGGALPDLGNDRDRDKLGARIGIDVVLAIDGTVTTTKPPPKQGFQGISVLPYAALNIAHEAVRPREFGGKSVVPIWAIKRNSITRDPKLAIVGETRAHATIAPSRCMPYPEYRNAIEMTRLEWRKVIIYFVAIDPNMI